jgi:hypothetical protein
VIAAATPPPLWLVSSISGVSGSSGIVPGPGGTAARELLALAGNFIVARAAFDISVALWPGARIELRQGARVIWEKGAPGI